MRVVIGEYHDLKMRRSEFGSPKPPHCVARADRHANILSDSLFAGMATIARILLTTAFKKQLAARLQNFSVRQGLRRSLDLESDADAALR